jgi:RimJ/RimL family protein N-acetyltransferase
MLRNWPISGLRLRTPRLELRWPSTADLDALADRAVEGIHDPAYMPFFSQWTDGDRDTVARRLLQRHWNALGTWSPQAWTLYLVVADRDGVMGSQSVGARDFASTREVVLTAWLARRFQRRGVGTHARAALLHFVFEGLGAHHAVVVIRQDNLPSQSLVRKFGFVPDGTQINAVRGQACVSDRYRLDRQTWEKHRAIAVEMTDWERGLALFGLGEAPRVPEVSADATGRPRPLVTAAGLSGVRSYDESDQDVD